MEETTGVEHLEGKLWYTFRHPFATRMLEAGHTAKAVADFAGWSNVETVLDIYHESDRDAQEALARSRPPTWKGR